MSVCIHCQNSVTTVTNICSVGMNFHKACPLALGPHAGTATSTKQSTNWTWGLVETKAGMKIKLTAHIVNRPRAHCNPRWVQKESIPSLAWKIQTNALHDYSIYKITTWGHKAPLIYVIFNISRWLWSLPFVRLGRPHTWICRVCLDAVGTKRWRWTGTGTSTGPNCGNLASLPNQYFIRMKDIKESRQCALVHLHWWVNGLTGLKSETPRKLDRKPTTPWRSTKCWSWSCTHPLFCICLEHWYK